MAWRDNLRPGSFRGVAFHTATGEMETGRRVALHEYPGRDEPWPEDLGRRSRTHEIECYVLGDDYMARRDALLAAAEAPGPGRLVHHWLGEFDVVVTACRLVESSRDGRMARFRLSLVEAGENTQPAGRADTGAAVADAADALLAAAESDFAGAYATDGLPQFVADAGAAILADFAGLFATSAGAATGDDAGAGAAASALLATFTDATASLARDPAGQAPGVTGLFRGVAGIAGGPSEALAILRRLAGFGSDLDGIAPVTAVRRQQGANQDAQTALVRRSTLAEMGRAAAQSDFASRDDAQELRDEFADLADTELDAAASAQDDAAFAAISALLASVVRDIGARGASLAPVRRVTLATPLPSLALAYDLYEDIGRADEVAGRAGARHPGFLPAGDEFGVLAA